MYHGSPAQWLISAVFCGLVRELGTWARYLPPLKCSVGFHKIGSSLELIRDQKSMNEARRPTEKEPATGILFFKYRCPKEKVENITYK